MVRIVPGSPAPKRTVLSRKTRKQSWGNGPCRAKRTYVPDDKAYRWSVSWISSETNSYLWHLNICLVLELIQRLVSCKTCVVIIHDLFKCNFFSGLHPTHWAVNFPRTLMRIPPTELSFRNKPVNTTIPLNSSCDGVCKHSPWRETVSQQPEAELTISCYLWLGC